MCYTTKSRRAVGGVPVVWRCEQLGIFSLVNRSLHKVPAPANGVLMLGLDEQVGALLLD